MQTMMKEKIRNLYTHPGVSVFDYVLNFAFKNDILNVIFNGQAL